MKYIVILGDGMADYPIEALDNKTILESAYKPNIDELAKKGILGMVKTVPDGMKPGSDVANLSAMGYDPESCYTGRSPLEAVSIGIDLNDTDIAFRCNLVTLSDEENYADKTMVDYSAGEITSEDAAKLIASVNEAFKNDDIEFYSGISYRHCMVWHEGPLNLGLTPPHDISDRKITEYMPENEVIRTLMEKSYDVLKDHPVNKERMDKGLRPGNSIWLWGEGTRPAVSNFEESFGLKGSAISAVDLIKGIAISAGLRSIDVEGATGNYDTNFAGKAKAAIDELLNGSDYVYIHMEAPDECGHRGELDNKKLSVELIDKEVVGPVVEAMRKAGEDFSILVMPDHPTPIKIKTHTSDPVPFLIYRSNDEKDSGLDSYNEKTAASTGLYIEKGYTLMQKFLNK
ncbi:MAG: cofactor-independent phosphoglycerate mutase [Lachnospiraceae bacterium]|nr:cofactor-independent phosphoglycerate mutase [Lachnospiraceae bacterium]